MATLTSIFDRKVVNLQPGSYYKITVGNNGTINAANNTLTTIDISDIQISTPVLNQVLQFNGSKWVNATMSSGGSTTTALSALTSDVTISSPANNHVLKHNGARWVNSSIDLSTLSNVLITNAVSGQVLKYDGAKWINGTDNVGSGSGSATISGLTDVQISTLVTNQVLQWNGSKWINATISSGGSATTALSALTSDVTISSPSNGQVLQFNGTRWVNATISSGGSTSSISNFEIVCTDWAAGSFVTPSGWTVSKVNSDTALQVTHNKGKTPLIWSGSNTASSPNLAIVPTATRNMQIDSSSQVTFLQVGTMTSFKLNLIFA